MLPGILVHLDGGGSTDDVTATQNLLFTWTLISSPAGSAATLTGGATATPSFVADRPGTYVAQLVVTDEDGQSTPADQVTISAGAVPVAEVPTLSKEGALLLAALLMVAALGLLRHAA